MITADQLLAHAIGDYVLQSDWMAQAKTKRSIAALCHVVTYSIPFLFLRPSWLALTVIVLTHFVVDRWRLARFVVLFKNWLFGGEFTRMSLVSYWHGSNQGTGYPEGAPIWLAFWLLIIADNLIHISINGLALRYL